MHNVVRNLQRRRFNPKRSISQEVTEKGCTDFAADFASAFMNIISRGPVKNSADYRIDHSGAVNKRLLSNSVFYILRRAFN